MTLKRFVMIVAVALIAATVPVAGKADGSAGLRLSTASCTEADCGSISKMDCICPDRQEKNRLPRCVEP